jgi:tetrahydromethanopterin S-methyltransferase subunit H
MTPAQIFHPVVAALEARVDALHEKQQDFDGAMIRIEDKLDGLKYWIMGTLVAAVGLGASASGALLLFILGRAK